MPTVHTDDGVNIFYQTRGGGPRDLLFMHGWAGSGAYWEATLDRLDLTGLRAITVDLRGHGNSDKPPAGYTQERFAKDTFAVADAAGAGKLVLVGFSMSARFVQYVACEEPARVLGLILVAGCPASEVVLPEEMHRDWVSRAGDRELMKQLVLMFTKQTVEPGILDKFGADAARVPQVVLDETLKMCRSSFIDKLEALRRTPTLAVGGIHDPIFNPEVMRQAVVALIPGARLALVDASHEIPIERPQEMAALIEAFLAGLRRE